MTLTAATMTLASLLPKSLVQLIDDFLPGRLAAQEVAIRARIQERWGVAPADPAYPFVARVETEACVREGLADALLDLALRVQPRKGSREKRLLQSLHQQLRARRLGAAQQLAQQRNATEAELRKALREADEEFRREQAELRLEALGLFVGDLTTRLRSGSFEYRNRGSFVGYIARAFFGPRTDRFYTAALLQRVNQGDVPPEALCPGQALEHPVVFDPTAEPEPESAVALDWRVFDLLQQCLTALPEAQHRPRQALRELNLYLHWILTLALEEDGTAPSELTVKDLVSPDCLGVLRHIASLRRRLLEEIANELEPGGSEAPGLELIRSAARARSMSLRPPPFTFSHWLVAALSQDMPPHNDLCMAMGNRKHLARAHLCAWMTTCDDTNLAEMLLAILES